MERHLPAEKFRENFRRDHCGIQLVFTGLNLSIRRLESCEEHEGHPALDQLLAFEQPRNLLKRGSFGNGDDFRRRVLLRGNGGSFSPFNGQICARAESGARDQQKNENAPQFHE